MSISSFVLVCALDLLGQSAGSFPPIHIVQRPADASPHATAFVRRDERAIYIVASSPLFSRLLEANRHRQQCREPDALRLLASMIVHEEWHLRHGPDERGAYMAQLTQLGALGIGPGRWPYDAVRQAMAETQARQAARLRAAGDMAASAR